eukprot:1147233-Pelagomonas_calceolata.AAC.1
MSNSWRRLLQCIASTKYFDSYYFNTMLQYIGDMSDNQRTLQSSSAFKDLHAYPAAINVPCAS